MDIPRVDGDSLRVWVRATDVMGNTKTDSVLVHVDSSPPVIQTLLDKPIVLVNKENMVRMKTAIRKKCTNNNYIPTLYGLYRVSL